MHKLHISRFHEFFYKFFFVNSLAKNYNEENLGTIITTLLIIKLKHLLHKQFSIILNVVIRFS